MSGISTLRLISRLIIFSHFQDWGAKSMTGVSLHCLPLHNSILRNQIDTSIFDGTIWNFWPKETKMRIRFIFDASAYKYQMLHKKLQMAPILKYVTKKLLAPQLEMSSPAFKFTGIILIQQ